MSDRKLTIEIQRFKPESDTEPHTQRFEIEAEPGLTVLDSLNRIREQQDATLSWRFSCRMGICGSCAMLINGKPGLACNTQIEELGGSRVKLAPLSNFPIVKDLVTDLKPMFDKHRALKPYLIRSDLDELDEVDRELEQSPAELLDYMQFSYCIKCAACVAACPTVAMDGEFPGPMPLTAAQRYNADSRDDGSAERSEALADMHGMPHCHYAGECSRVCPKGVDPALAIQLMKREALSQLLRPKSRTPVGTVAPRETRTDIRDEELRPPDFTVRR